VDDHVTGRDEHTDRLWTLMNMELWQRRFIDGEQDVRAPDSQSQAAFA